MSLADRWRSWLCRRLGCRWEQTSPDAPKFHTCTRCGAPGFWVPTAEEDR